MLDVVASESEIVISRLTDAETKHLRVIDCCFESPKYFIIWKGKSGKAWNGRREDDAKGELHVANLCRFLRARAGPEGVCDIDEGI